MLAGNAWFYGYLGSQGHSSGLGEGVPVNDRIGPFFSGKWLLPGICLLCVCNHKNGMHISWTMMNSYTHLCIYLFIYLFIDLIFVAYKNNKDNLRGLDGRRRQHRAW